MKLKLNTVVIYYCDFHCIRRYYYLLAPRMMIKPISISTSLDPKYQIILRRLRSFGKVFFFISFMV